MVYILKNNKIVHQRIKKFYSNKTIIVESQKNQIASVKCNINQENKLDILFKLNDGGSSSFSLAKKKLKYNISFLGKDAVLEMDDRNYFVSGSHGYPLYGDERILIALSFHGKNQLEQYCLGIGLGKNGLLFFYSHLNEDHVIELVDSFRLRAKHFNFISFFNPKLSIYEVNNKAFENNPDSIIENSFVFLLVLRELFIPHDISSERSYSMKSNLISEKAKQQTPL